MSQESQRVCIVVPGIDLHQADARILNDFAALAGCLAGSGHSVSILATSEDDASSIVKMLGTPVKTNEIAVVTRPQSTNSVLPLPLAHSWSVRRYLDDELFDLVVFGDHAGLGLYCILAKHTGVAFLETKFIVGLHSPTYWCAEAIRRLPERAGFLLSDAAERKCAELADHVVSPSSYMVEALRLQGWELSKNLSIIPYPIGSAAPRFLRTEEAIEEIVFIGSHGIADQLKLFLRSLNRIDSKMVSSLRFSFASEFGELDREDIGFIESNRPKWAIAWSILSEETSENLTEYLSHSGRLAFIADPFGNSPSFIRRCLESGIPFLAPKTGSIPELIEKGERDFRLFEPNPESIAHIIRLALEGKTWPAKGLRTENEIALQWNKLIDSPPDHGDSLAERSLDHEPMVSVVVTTRNRPDKLHQALNGLRNQTWKKFEVILVDDGSDLPEAVCILDSLQDEFDAKGWRIIRQGNRYLGAARNAGWRSSKGEFVIFHDDDNISGERLIESYVNAMHTSRCDIATCALVPFEGEEPPCPLEDADAVFAPIGDASTAGFYMNAFGDAHACFRRSALERLNGFSEDFGVGHEDWEIFAKAQIMGLKLVSVPMPLFWYRVAANSMLRSRTVDDPDYLRSARPYLEAAPPQLRPVLQYSLGLFLGTAESMHGRVVTTFSNGDLVSLAISALPSGWRDEERLRAGAERRITWAGVLKRNPLAIREAMFVRRLNRMDRHGKSMADMQTLVLAALSRRPITLDRVREFATFRRSWQEIARRYPTRISYWQAARRIQAASRKMIWG